MVLTYATGKEMIDDSSDRLAALWSFFDRIYCISLKTRDDRRAAALAEFTAVGLGDRVEFVVVDKHPTDCEQGIYESHLNCMARGLAAGAEHILIFEDDIVFKRFSAAKLADAVRFMENELDWQVMFFGCLVNKSRKTRYPSVIEICYRSLAHAYAVPRGFAEELVREHPWRNIAFDKFLRNYESSRMYAVYPAVAFQSNASSDNDPYLPLDRVRRLCGGLQTIQRCNEFYKRNQWLIICGHLAIISAIAVML